MTGWPSQRASRRVTLAVLVIGGALSYDRPRQLLANFGFTPAQIQQPMNALTSGTAGISAGGFMGIAEPTVDATHHVDGGCRSTSADGSQWECYIAPAAVQRQVISPPSNRPGSTGLGAYMPTPGVG